MQCEGRLNRLRNQQAAANRAFAMRRMLVQHEGIIRATDL
jgi:hypothetical protein